MKLWGIFRFEVAYHLRRASTWVYFAALLALATSLTLVFVNNARKEVFYFNAPIIVAAVTVLSSLFGLLVAAALASDAATRDLQTRMTPLHYSVPITKGEYLGGRFLGALAVYALMLLVVVPLAFALVARLPGLEPELIGPLRPAAYLSAYALFALPNAVVAIALLFAGAVLSRRALTSYVVGVLLFMLSIVAKELVAVEAGRWTLAMHLDPSGFTGISALWRSWTTFQKNNLLIPVQGELVSSRLLWLGIAVGALGLTYAHFRFAHHVSGRGDGRKASLIDRFWRRGVAAAKAFAVPEALNWNFATSMPVGRPTPGTRVAQLLVIAGRSFREIIGSRAAWALPLLAVLLVVAGPELLEGELGTPSLPTTARLAGLAGHQLLRLLVAALTTLFAGQLVWQERDAGLNELTDASPVPDWVVYVGKFLGLVGLLVGLQVVVMAAGMFIQLSLDYHRLEAGLYLRILFGLHLPNQLLFAVVALVGHVLVRDKYVGHLVVFFLYLYTAFAGKLGIEHPLLVYGADPGWRYTEMGGFGAFIGPVLWFKAYWASWALLLGLLVMLFWVRSREPELRWRMRLASHRFRRGPAVVAACGTGLVLLLGSFIFYNTNVRNHYQSDAARTERRAAYERRFGRYRNRPQPTLTGTKLNVELYPKLGQAQVEGTYQLVNQGTLAIDSIHMVSPTEVITIAVRCDRPARLVLAEKELGYHILVVAVAEPGFVAGRCKARSCFSTRRSFAFGSVNGCGPTICTGA
ncbi:MAG: transporter permease, partial [Hymenobacter sp.]|nr:transporter permease [Hymenobacter sp.]